MYFQHNPISQDLAHTTCDLAAPLRRDFRHTRRAPGCPPASCKKRPVRSPRKHFWLFGARL